MHLSLHIRWFQLRSCWMQKVRISLTCWYHLFLCLMHGIVLEGFVWLGINMIESSYTVGPVWGAGDVRQFCIYLARCGVISGDYCHNPPSCHRVHSHAYDWWPLPASVETTSVLLGVDTETACHPTITISMPHWRGSFICLLDDWGGDHSLPEI